MSRGGGAGRVSSTRGGSVVSDELISRGRGRGREDSCGGELGGRFEPAPYTRRGGLRRGGDSARSAIGKSSATAGRAGWDDLGVDGGRVVSGLL